MEREKLTVRMPKPLKLQLQAAAERDGRTLNAEIVHFLRHCVTGYGP